ncbi:hypothetical protein MBCUT_08120 [Methanobrevibacter cuticularis]|uniref:Uncharacterized protein n=1 Tax=Methanobrevibacter cuticularis TaxID=47311 RepID=A0A166ECP4_9EURY|nr:DUF1786 domain-containing protein [Methanobrevibacter cuticularis]KZX16510.1 hypothetical protein MBCUT_08120 [Methanobrevibacter cuticularis]
MKILAIDIGAGTQDILFHDNTKELENSIKLVLPSPPVIIVQKIENTNNDLYFDGDIMGGGKIKDALIAHMEKGYEIAMETNAARTVKDDLRVVEDIGVEIVEKDSYEINPKFANYSKITLEDVNVDELISTIAKYDLKFSFDIIAIAVQDHGFSDKMGDRDFRFEKIREKLSKPKNVEEFAYWENVPEYFSRMKAVERTLRGKIKNLHPILMDSKFASVCGACADPEVSKLNSFVVMDIGNGHTMAASIEDGKIQGVFEHHTSNLAGNSEKIEKLINKLVNGTITHADVHDDHGHGAHVINPISKLEKVVITGPKRSIIEDTNLDYYNASPGGDVMMTGPIGLIKVTEHFLKEEKP